MGTRIVYQERTGWSWWVHPLIMLTFLAAVFPLIELAKGNVGGGEGAMSVWEAGLLLAIGHGASHRHLFPHGSAKDPGDGGGPGYPVGLR